MGNHLRIYSVLAISIALLTSCARAQDTTCVDPLMGCLPFVNTDATPTKACCDPLRMVILTKPQCLCNALGRSWEETNSKINMTAVENVLARCGLHVSIDYCTEAESPTSREMDIGFVNKASLRNAVLIGVICLLQLLWE